MISAHPSSYLFVCYRNVAATMAHDPKTALRYYDVLGTSASRSLLSGWVSLKSQRRRLDPPADDAGSDFVPDSRPPSPSTLAAGPSALPATAACRRQLLQL